LAGVHVVELGLWLAAPACASILADWGADVVKIEPLGGDPFRGLAWAYGGEMNPPFELDNRGKRSVAVDLRTEGGQEVIAALLAEADVFITNYRPGGLERLGLDWPTLHARHPRLIYGSITGYGLAGPERDRASYDMGAYWGRAGVAAALTPPGQDLPYQRGGFGDHLTGMSLAGGVSAALFARHRTGEGQLVATSLLRIGAYVLGWDLNATLRMGIHATPFTRTATPNPVISCYRAGDGRWFWLLGLQGQRHWPDLVRAIERPEWLADERFATMAGRRDNCAALVADLDAIFATRPLPEWGERFDRAGMWWAAVQTTEDVIADPQARAAGVFIEVPQPDADPAPAVASPIDFSGTPWSVSGPAPECGQHTEDVLLELGYDWEAIGALKEKGAIP
jgi:crotonobetainyl-CoA:carnitine CoA-transferase CaiB-like acyl-CoA transferase